MGIYLERGIWHEFSHHHGKVVQGKQDCARGGMSIQSNHTDLTTSPKHSGSEWPERAPPCVSSRLQIMSVAPEAETIEMHGRVPSTGVRNHPVSAVPAEESRRWPTPPEPGLAMDGLDPLLCVSF